MSKKHAFKYSRKELLELEIRKLYEHRDPWTFPDDTPPEDYIVEMFEVKKVVGNHAHLIQYFSREEYIVRVFERSMLELIAAGDVFLLSNFKFADEWQIWCVMEVYD